MILPPTNNQFHYKFFSHSQMKKKLRECFFFQFQFNTQRPNARPQPSVSRLRSLSCWTSSPLKLNTIIIESRERFMHSPQLDIGNRASRDNCVQLNSSILVTLRSIIIAPVWWSWTGRELTWWNFLVVSIPSPHTQHIAELSWNVPMRQLYVWMWKCNLRFLWKKEKKKNIRVWKLNRCRAHCCPHLCCKGTLELTNERAARA